MIHSHDHHSLSDVSQHISAEGRHRCDFDADVPLLLHHAFEAYRARVLVGFPSDAKEFVSAQAACRAALAHVMLLLRLEERLSKGKSDRSDEEGVGLDEMISEARTAVSNCL